VSKLNQAEMMESKAAAAVPCRDIVRRRVSRSAYIRAVQTEGTHVATAEGEPWWREQERKHPCILAGGNRPEGTDSPNGHVNRFGRVKERMVGGKWYHWAGGKWVEGEAGKRRGLR
jgi:hypothetical protein